jgi:hypothetical protein
MFEGLDYRRRRNRPICEWDRERSNPEHHSNSNEPPFSCTTRSIQRTPARHVKSAASQAHRGATARTLRIVQRLVSAAEGEAIFR